MVRVYYIPLSYATSRDREPKGQLCHLGLLGIASSLSFIFFSSSRFLISMKKKKVYKVYLGWDKHVLDRTFAREADAIKYADSLAVDTLIVSSVL